MHTLELTSNQLLMMKDIIETDMFLSEQDMPDFKDEEQMLYYFERCQVYNQVLEELST